MDSAFLRNLTELDAQMYLKLRRLTLTTRFLLPSIIILIAACSKSDRPSIRAFATPDDAGSALLAAGKSGDQNALLAIFGPDSKQLIFSDDPVEDKGVVDRFVAAYGVMHRWRKMVDGSQVLLVGADNFPFPIPLKKDRSGRWFFDTDAGKEEILSRRIGRNELAIIEVCKAVASAQNQYFAYLRDGAAKKQYAMKFISDPGKHNGLYWPTTEGQPESPLGPLAAFATSEGYVVKPDAHAPFHGYYFRMLKGQTQNARGGAKDYVADGRMVRGFALIAYPAEYGNSGVMTFIMNQDGVPLEKDMGKTTTAVAAAMTNFDPDGSWTVAQE